LAGRKKTREWEREVREVYVTKKGNEWGEDYTEYTEYTTLTK
jgi:hypothetical protein